MWSRARELYEGHRATLAAAGIPLRAEVVPADGLYCHYRAGRVHLALPDPATPAGRLQGAVIGAWLGMSVDDVGALFDALLPRLVGHEIGHALRDEAGRLGPDPVTEEQAADRIATLLSAGSIPAGTVARLHACLFALGGPGAAAGLHRDAARLADELGITVDEGAASALRHRMTTDYARDLDTFLRTTLAWTWIDLSLDLEDSLDACRHALL